MVPVTEVLPEETSFVYTDRYNDVITKLCKGSIADSAGMPINVQVATPRWRDEECLGLMKVIENEVNFKKTPNLNNIDKERSESLHVPDLWPLFRKIMLVVMAIAYVAAGTNHFLNPEFYIAMMPTWIPFHKFVVEFTGVCEIAGGIGVLLPFTRKLAAWCIIALLFCVFPANIHMAIFSHQFSHIGPAWVAWLRLPLQFLMIDWARWYTY